MLKLCPILSFRFLIFMFIYALTYSFDCLFFNSNDIPYVGHMFCTFLQSKKKTHNQPSSLFYQLCFTSIHFVFNIIVMFHFYTITRKRKHFQTSTKRESIRRSFIYIEFNTKYMSIWLRFFCRYVVCIIICKTIAQSVSKCFL